MNKMRYIIIYICDLKIMEPVWSIEEMQDAEMKRQFILVTAIYMTTLPRTTIMDIQDVWRMNGDVVFHTGYRIAGTPDDIASELNRSGIPNEDIEDVLNTTITKENYDGIMKPLVEDEINKYYEWKRGALKYNSETPGFRLYDIMKQVNPEMGMVFQMTKKGKVIKATPAETPVKTKSRGGRVKPLIDKVNDLPEGKVLDVSDMTDTGAGTKAITPTLRSKKYGSPDLPIISNNFERYLMAIDLLPGGRERYADEIQYVSQLFNETSVSQQTFTPTLDVSQIETKQPPQFIGDLTPFSVPLTEEIEPIPIKPIIAKKRRRRKKDEDKKINIEETEQQNDEQIGEQTEE